MAALKKMKGIRCMVECKKVAYEAENPQITRKSGR